MAQLENMIILLKISQVKWANIALNSFSEAQAQAGHLFTELAERLFNLTRTVRKADLTITTIHILIIIPLEAVAARLHWLWIWESPAMSLPSGL